MSSGCVCIILYLSHFNCAWAVGHVWYILCIRIQLLGHVHSHVVVKMEKEQLKRDHVEMEREQLKHGHARARKQKQRDTASEESKKSTCLIIS